MWQRACPWCQAHGVNVTLEKKLLSLIVHCNCGWVWGPQPDLPPRDPGKAHFQAGESFPSQ